MIKPQLFNFSTRVIGATLGWDALDFSLQYRLQPTSICNVNWEVRCLHNSLGIIAGSISPISSLIIWIATTVVMPLQDDIILTTKK